MACAAYCLFAGEGDLLLAALGSALRSLESIQSAFCCFRNRCRRYFRKAVGQSLKRLIDLRLAGFSEFFDNPRGHLRRKTVKFRRLHEVTRSNRVHCVVPLCTDCHGKLHLVLANLLCVKAGLCRDHVIERREAKSPTRGKTNAEVLGMTVRRAQQPEDDLCFEEKSLVGLRRVAAFQQFRNIADARSTVGLIFAGGRNGKGLATILLRLTQKSLISCPQPVEAFDNEHAPSRDIGNRGVCSRNTECADELQTQIFVLNAV